MPSEESHVERALSLVAEAREPIRALVGIGDVNGLSGAERNVLVALQRLADAIECAVDPSPILHLDLGADQLHRIRNTIRGESPKFVVSFPDVELDVSDIWDDGTAPVHPTPEHVVEVMREALSEDEPGSLQSVLRDWVLVESLFVREAHDEDAAGEVEWDGT